jgi:hypothetical protein
MEQTQLAYQVLVEVDHNDLSHKYVELIGAFTTFDLALARVEQYCKTHQYPPIVWESVDRDYEYAYTKPMVADTTVFVVKPLRIEHSLREDYG